MCKMCIHLRKKHYKLQCSSAHKIFFRRDSNSLAPPVCATATVYNNLCTYNLNNVYNYKIHATNNNIFGTAKRCNE